MPALVLVVEDEPAIQSVIEINLRRSGLDVLPAPDAATALRLLGEVVPSLMLVDWMLPDITGPELVVRLRADPRTRDVPIVMVTAKGDEPSKIEALELGVDDYITKPFSPRELVARVRSLLRRTVALPSDGPVQLGSLMLDPSTYRVLADGVPVRLGPTEFRLLHFLMTHPERVYSRAMLLDQVWGDHVFVEERTVDVLVRRVRAQLTPSGCHRMIQTVRGAGYRLSETLG